MPYVTLEEGRKENYGKSNSSNHYIIALDDSGSMSGSNWNALEDSVKALLEKIKEKNEPNLKISIVLISSQKIYQ